jgi:hypothetical protein
LLAEFQKTPLLSLSRVSGDDQIISFYVTEAAQLPKKRSEGWIAPSFVHVGDGSRSVNYGDAVRLCRLLGTSRKRPSRSATKGGDKLPPLHSNPPAKDQAFPV